MTESLNRFEAKLDDKCAETQIYRGIAVLEGSAEKFLMAKVQLEKLTVELAKLTEGLQKAALLRLQIDAVLLLAYGIVRAANETSYDCIARVYKIRADQVQAYIAMRNAGGEHEEAERAALAIQVQ